MKLEDQVCSLESARRLKELGVRQESLFFWNFHPQSGSGSYSFPEIGWVLENFMSAHPVSAFTVAELGEMLPSAINVLNPTKVEHLYESEEIPTAMYHLSCGRSPSQKGFWCSYDLDENHIHKTFVESTEAEARVKMLIYLIENKLVKAGRIGGGATSPRPERER